MRRVVMKLSLFKVGVVTCLAAGLFYGEVSAVSVQAAEYSSSGDVALNVNPSFQEINRLLTSAALEAGIPPEVVKAVATQESGWKQFNENGEPYISNDGGIGIMQITNQSNYDPEKLKYDIAYNIQAGVEILSSIYNRTDLPRVKNGGKQVIESWYFPVMAFNGTKPANSPVVQSTGDKNPDAYQEKVFAHIENDSFLKLGQFLFRSADFQYSPDSDENIEFVKKEYTVDKTHDSSYFFKQDDQVVVTEEGAKLRPQPGTTQEGTKLHENTALVVTGDFQYDQNMNSLNQFVWVPVKTADQKLTGYISSAYIAKGSANTTPVASFTDVSAKYQDAVSFVVSKGINGFSPTTFGTGENIKRVDAAVMLAEVCDLDIESAPAAEFTDVPARAVKQVNALKAAGITSGKTATTFDAQSEITRGELAIWIQRAFHLQESGNTLPFSDVGDRYTQAVSALVNNGVTNGTSVTTFGTYDHAKRGDYAIFMYRAAQK